MSQRVPTVRDVAARAGVSVGTVSKALNNRGQLRKETRARVVAEAAITWAGRQNTSATCRRAVRRKLRACRSRRLIWMLPLSRRVFLGCLLCISITPYRVMFQGYNLPLLHVALHVAVHGDSYTIRMFT